jgi:RecJ-like exonuclease
VPTVAEACPNCDGTGHWVSRPTRRSLFGDYPVGVDVEGSIAVSHCPYCKGTGRVEVQHDPDKPSGG